MSKKKKKKLIGLILVVIIAIVLVILWKTAPELSADAPSEPAKTEQAVTQETNPPAETEPPKEAQSGSVQLTNVPEYTGEPFCVLNDNMPEFTEEEITTEAYEFFTELDELERCGVTMACVGQELMPTEDRESISHVKPSGWVNVPYDFVDGRYLYNRCHLIGFQLTGENDNDRNLITGTRYMNVDGMLPFENMVADYVKETDNHVMYRVTPIFHGDELVARGVQMEAWSVEDQGDGLCYNVYIYNVQPGVEIDYATGESWESGEAPKEDEPEENDKGKETKQTYVVNTGSKKFHLPDCSGVENMNESKKVNFQGTRSEAIAEGYEPCGQCKP